MTPAKVAATRIGCHPVIQVRSDARYRFCLYRRRKSLPGVAAPRACGIESDEGLPMALRFVLRAEFFTNERQVVVRVGITWIETESVAKMQPRRFQPANFFENAAKVEMSQSALGINLQGAHEIFRGFLRVAFFVAKSSAIEQRVDFQWINAQRMI